MRVFSLIMGLMLGLEIGWAQNRFTAPYLTDGPSLHLWHLDDGATPVADAGSNPFPLEGLFNGATLGASAAPGFGGALNADAGVVNAFGILTLAPVLAADATDNAPPNFAWFGADGAFTLEAMIKLDVLPVNSPGGALGIITMEGDANERVFNFRIEKSATPSLNLLVLPNSGVVSNSQGFSAPIPLVGAHALATNAWFHVAVSYDGNAGASNNMMIYWTRLDSGATAANLIGSNSLPADFVVTNGDFALGNDARSANGENEVFPGQIDEVRISAVVRAATNFIFHAVTLAGASGSDANVPVNSLDGDFSTRWSASGDGQWIAYDLGRTQLVTGVSIAFYLGDTRTTSFDVQISGDNTNWTTMLLHAVSSGTTTDLEWFDFPDVPARYLRLVGHGNSVSAWNSLTEVVIGLAAGGDSDHDGLPDSWEQFYFGNLLQGATDDPDLDGLGNLREFYGVLQPTMPQSSADADGDGMADAWEMQYFGSTTQPATGDLDRDGYSNLIEFQQGTHPLNPNSIPGDVEGDNLPDAWEWSAFGTLTNWAYEDSDADGYNNTAELVAGASPTNSASKPNWSAPRVALLNNTIVTTNACLMPTGSTYGRNLNGGSFQADILITLAGYQYTAWYDNVGSTTSTQTVWLARRTVNRTSVGPWEAVSTGSVFINGKTSWDAHNTISLGISPVDGTLHLAWDHHGHTLRYRRSVVGLCTTNQSAWGVGMMQPEQNWLIAAGQTVTGVTYPAFFVSPANELFFAYRAGGSGNGDTWMAQYNPATGAWQSRWQFLNRAGTFTGINNSGVIITSNSRNAYDNGFDFGPDGTLHYTWCYREQNGAFNHDILYAASPNGGVTWLNNAGAVIANASLGQTITLNSPGTIIKPVEGTQQMINQQAQCVDGDGRVHVLMFHRRVEPGFEWQLGDSAFGGAETAYYHYFRDPVTRVWSQRRLPTTYAVGSRPKVGYDASANVYAIYNSGSKLIVASASKASSYTDWNISSVVNGNFSGESLLDQERFTQDGILSVYHQENAGSSSVPTNATLRVVEFVVNVPNPAPVSLSFLGADALVTVAATPGFSYQLQTRTNLGLGTWVNIGGSVAGHAGLLTLPHGVGAIGPQRYYRVVRTP